MKQRSESLVEKTIEVEDIHVAIEWAKLDYPIYNNPFKSHGHKYASKQEGR